MKINGEPVEKVTDFKSLHTGMTVFGHCWTCGQFHRGMLMTLPDPAREHNDPGSFELTPLPKSHQRFKWMVVTPGCVAEGRVYRLVIEDITEVVEHKDIKKPAKV